MRPRRAICSVEIFLGLCRAKQAEVTKLPFNATRHLEVIVHIYLQCNTVIIVIIITITIIIIIAIIINSTKNDIWDMEELFQKLTNFREQSLMPC